MYFIRFVSLLQVIPCIVAYFVLLDHPFFLFGLASNACPDFGSVARIENKTKKTEKKGQNTSE